MRHEGVHVGRLAGEMDGNDRRVRGVIAASTAPGSRLNVSRSMSANTGTAFASTTAEAVEMNVYGGTMTSSSAWMPAASSAIRSETVPLTTATPWPQPCIAAKRRSNSSTCWPSSLPHSPLRSVRSRRSSSASPKMGQEGNGRVRIGDPPNRASTMSSELVQSPVASCQ